jgi:hypothetical protein
MESTLLAGRFSAPDAEQLLDQLFKTKIAFHTARIDTANMSEEDIRHSEKKILALEDELKKIINSLRSRNAQYVALSAKLVIEFCPDYYNVAPVS